MNDSTKKTTPSHRYKTKEMAQIEVYGRMGKIFCKMSNLSQSGAFLEIINSNFLPKSGDLVRMTILLKQLNKTHIIDAEIIWSRGLGLGLSFLKKPDLVEKLSTRLSAS
jgi:hypothetical protein